MTKQKALSLVRKKHGKTGFIRENKHAPDPETREIMRKELEKVMTEKPTPPPPTPEQLKYQEDFKKWREARDNLQGRIWRRRWDVGYVSMGMFAHIVGSGDTLSEACQKANLS